jgi:molybdopterin/thiamine biosynthesis adenylyltransferase
MKPAILAPGKFTAADLDQLRKASKIWRAVDIHDSQLKELAEITHPGNQEAQAELISQHEKGDTAGAWVYYPWSGTLLHCLGGEDIFKIRTNRNKNLITEEEQRKLAASSVAVAGMSVGSGIALASVYSGMSRSLKIADFDVLETANLNRLRASLTDIGTAKSELAARRVYELDPFADVQIFDQGIDESNIDNFFENTAIVVDEIDDFKMKVRLRLKAKERHVPLLMFTSLGDNILVDVERYDREPELAIFNGAIGEVPEEILQKGSITPEDAKRYAVQLVGQEYVPTRAMASLPEIGKTLVGRPQLYGTITTDSGLASYLIKMILLGEDVKSGRYFIKFADLFDLDTGDLAESAERQETLRRLLG